tara:strand:- start:125 stop:2152 length:2028 start_codon:yes stop_codon:yes gene_type:complete
MVKLSGIRQAVEEQQGTAGLDSAQVLNITGSALQVFDALDSLPMTGLSEGDEAFIKNTNRLYISDGSGWYNTTLVNRTPTWSTEPDATYDIADSATPLVITALATDSDNPDTSLLNQSVATDSAQYMVDVSNDSSVWTFTPKTASQIGAAVAAGNLTDSNGDFVYTFKWSDGISFVSKSVTIAYNPASGGGSASATGFLSALRWSTNYAGGAPQFTANAVVQDHNGGAYYQAVIEETEDAAWIVKYDEDGTYQWARELGTYYLRAQDVMVDDNGDVIFVGHDYGFGDNTSPSPQLGYIAKFNSSGTNQWKKVVKWADPYNNGGQTVDLQYGDMDGYGNIWTCFPTYYNTSNQSTAYINNLAKLSNTDGSIQGTWSLPHNSSSNTSINAFMLGMSIDRANNKMYMTFSIGSPSSGYNSSRHTVVQRLSIPSSGNPTIDWSYIYGRNYGSTHDDRGFDAKLTSDGNIILSGLTIEGSTNNPIAFVMKIQASDGAILWQKQLDSTYHADYPYFNSAVDNNDKIWILGQTGFNGNHYIQILDGDDGSHVSLHQIEFKTGATNYTIQRGYATSMTTNKDGNVLLSARFYDLGGGSPPVWLGIIKFPATLSAGTSDNSNFTATSVSAPSNTNWNASKQTHTSFSISPTSWSYSSVNYNSGTHSDNVYTVGTPHSSLLDVIS